MTVFTEGKHPAEGLLTEANGTLSREVLTIKSGAGIVAAMTVLGKITADGKYIPAPAAEVVGSEGAEVAVAVNLYEVDATDADVKVTGIVRDAELIGDLLTYDPSRDLDAEKLAAKVDLAAVGIIVR